MRVFKKGNKELPKCLERNNNQPLESLMFTEEEILKANGRMKTPKSQGQYSTIPICSKTENEISHQETTRIII